jgi:uncharacterized protein (DUF885 family)
MRIFAAFAITLSLFSAMATAQNKSSEPEARTHAATGTRDAEWNKLVDSYFDQYFQLNPTQATSAGFHQHDGELDDMSRQGIDAEVEFLHRYKDRIEKFAPEALSPEAASDRELLLASVNGQLLDLEKIRQWEKNPDRYSSLLASSAFTIMSRSYAPPAERLKSLIARERQMPRALEAARQNLKNPPRIYTEIALQQIPGITGFFQKDVPDAFREVKDAKLLADFQASNQGVIDALKSYQEWIKTDLLPRSNGDFRIGADNYRQKLLDDEMVDVPLDKLLEIGYADLHKNQQRFKETAARIDPKKTPEEVLADLQKDYPPPDKLLQTVRDLFGGLRGFITSQKIVTIPSPVQPIVEETPPFMRALTFASMDTPGPYEAKAKEAYFNVTLPEKSFTPRQVTEFMAQFNYNTLTAIATHEAYPGHYVQFLWVQHAPSKVRKLVGCGSNAEGWAHYSEQMMLDEGYGRTPGVALDQDMKFQRLRLGQLQDALLRDARFIVGISMHTGRMTFDQAVDFFVKEGYQSHQVAETETKRGTSDPTYLVYTLGKLEILKLREDYRRKTGADFDLEKFHNDFLQQGFPPIKLIRRAMLGDNSPVL